MKTPFRAALAHLVRMSAGPRDARLREMAGGPGKHPAEEESETSLEAELEKHLGEEGMEGDKVLQVQPGSVEAEHGSPAAEKDLTPDGPDTVAQAASNESDEKSKKATKAPRFRF
jgi:hypothetical protein